MYTYIHIHIHIRLKILLVWRGQGENDISLPKIMHMRHEICVYMYVCVRMIMYKKKMAATNKTGEPHPRRKWTYNV